MNYVYNWLYKPPDEPEYNEKEYSTKHIYEQLILQLEYGKFLHYEVMATADIKRVYQYTIQKNIADAIKQVHQYVKKKNYKFVIREYKEYTDYYNILLQIVNEPYVVRNPYIPVKKDFVKVLLPMLDDEFSEYLERTTQIVHNNYPFLYFE